MDSPAPSKPASVASMMHSREGASSPVALSNQPSEPELSQAKGPAQSAQNLPDPRTSFQEPFRSGPQPSHSSQDLQSLQSFQEPSQSSQHLPSSQYPEPSRASPTLPDIQHSRQRPQSSQDLPGSQDLQDPSQSSQDPYGTNSFQKPSQSLQNLPDTPNPEPVDPRQLSQTSQHLADTQPSQQLSQSSEHLPAAHSQPPAQSSHHQPAPPVQEASHPTPARAPTFVPIPIPVEEIGLALARTHAPATVSSHTKPPTSPTPGTPRIYNDRVPHSPDTIRVREPQSPQQDSHRTRANVARHSRGLSYVDPDRGLPPIPQPQYIDYGSNLRSQSPQPQSPHMPHPQPVRQGTHDSRYGPVRSPLDHIVPTIHSTLTQEKEPDPRSVGARLKPTRDTAEKEKLVAEKRAKSKGRTLNIAIGLQVMLGALTTGLAAVSTDRKLATVVSVMGGASTVISTYMAKARGENEPETSEALFKNLEQFIRELDVFIMDHGYKGSEDQSLNEQIGWFRQRLEDLLTGEDRHEVPKSKV